MKSDEAASFLPRLILHILFVNHHNLDSNSGVHIFNLANHLSLMGIRCTVCVPNQKETAQVLGHCEFDVHNFDDLIFDVRLKKVDLIHAWTPRERVRMMTERLVRKFDAPYIVHLEDNEEFILESNLGIPIPDLLDLPEQHLGDSIPAHLSHPVRYKQFLKHARGATMLMDRLQDFCPDTEARTVIWPGFEEKRQWHRAPDDELRRRLHIESNEFVVVYTGNVHHANRREVFSLYLAVGLLNRRRIRTRLVRTGTDYVRLYDSSLKTLDQYCISLGYLPRAELPSILSIADVLVQPGKADAFNIYRFPSKLPEYLASGKPVLLPAVNIGRFLKDGENAILLQQGNALEIAQKLETLLPDAERREKIGTGGRLFAEANLTWRQSAKTLSDFYTQLLNV